MSNTIIINSSNATSQKHIFNYKFINGAFTCNENTKISVSSVSIPYSWFNVSTINNNNKFTLTWVVGTTVTSYPFTIPDGFYTVTTINQYIQQKCLDNGFYLINESGQNVFYFDLSYNETYYGVQLLLFPIPISLPVGWTQPTIPAQSANFAGYPTVSRCPQFILPATGSIGSIIGFASNTTYGLLSTPLSQSILSTLTPQGTTVNSVLMRCSLIENNIAMPSDILDSFAITSSFGNNIVYEPSFNKWVKVKSGKYNIFSLSFNDELGNALPMRDTNILVTLLLKQD
jgi:hypothetical protein